MERRQPMPANHAGSRSVSEVTVKSIAAYVLRRINARRHAIGCESDERQVKNGSLRMRNKALEIDLKAKISALQAIQTENIA